MLGPIVRISVLDLKILNHKDFGPRLYLQSVKFVLSVDEMIVPLLKLGGILLQHPMN